MAKIYIKNMVCDRCKLVVGNELEKLAIHPIAVELGEVTLETEMTAADKNELAIRLNELGFELIDDKKTRLTENIKKHIIDLVHHQDGNLKVNLSDYLGQKLNHDYNYISNLFSEIEHITIEKYFIAQKIERVKELIAYGELSLSEIAYQLNYSSIGHLSNQFKKITGQTPSQFKNNNEDKRKSLDQV